jgi:hypothetical protein
MSRFIGADEETFFNDLGTIIANLSSIIFQNGDIYGETACAG